MLKLRNITKQYDNLLAVNNISLDIIDNTIFGLLGPNGAGKTTTIRMIMDILKPDSGELYFRDHLIQRNDFKRIGYLPEDRGLYQKSKLREMIVYMATLKQLHRKDAAEKADQWLKRFELTQYADRKVEELSKGNQQKVQFILSIIHEPELLILDEPFTGLDPVNQLLIKEIIREMQQKGATIVFSTHQMEQVEKMCSDICLINKGQVVLNGPIKEIKREYGNRGVLVEFSGEPAKLNDLTTIRNVDIDKNTLNAEMGEEFGLNDVLKEIIERVEIHHFDIKEPSLEHIFIDQVRKGGRQ